MHEIYKQNNLPYLTVKSCPECGKLVPAETLVCPACKHDFENIPSAPKTVEAPKQPRIVLGKNQPTQAAEQPVQQPVQQQAEPQPVEQPARPAQPSNKITFCENCGTRLVSGQNFCGNCGTRVARIFCRYCGESIDQDQSYCPYCGKPVVHAEKPAEQPVQQPVQPQIQPVIAQPIYGYQPFFGYPQGQYQQPVYPQDMAQTTSMPNPFAPQAQVASQTEEKPAEQQAQEVPPLENTQVTDTTTAMENEVEKEQLPDEDIKEVVNMGRKRTFLILEFIFLLVIAFLAAALPVLSSVGPFYGEGLAKVFNGETIGQLAALGSLEDPSLVTGIRYIWFAIAKITEGNYAALFNGLNEDFYTLGGNVISSYQIGAVNLNGTDNLFIQIFIAAFYIALAVTFVITLIEFIVSLFVRKPFKVIGFGTLTVVLAVGSVVIYPQIFIAGNPFADMAKYDTWIIYAFALSFLLWFIMKLVFLKETKVYSAMLDEKDYVAEHPQEEVAQPEQQEEQPAEQPANN